MLSYQHAYHAGGRADIHKHEILCRALESMIKKHAPIVYLETHAGRGIYDLKAAEARKTGEAEDGWLKFIKDKKFLENLSPGYVKAVRKLNHGKPAPRYPGSPWLAAHILRAKDSSHLMELHPAENAALKENFAKDKRVRVYKKDGFEGALDLKEKPGFVLIDPSYEVKAEYETIPDFAAAFHQKWPRAVILIWAPMLPAKRHEAMLKKIGKNIPAAEISEARWANPEDGRGMYGSIMVGINVPGGFQSGAASFISGL